MEGLFILLFIGIVFFSIIKSNNKDVASSSYSKHNKTGTGHEVPEVLRAKWAKQEQQKRSSKMQQAHNRANASHIVWKTAKKTSENVHKQSRSMQMGQKVESSALSHNGEEGAVDKNPNRRNDWGKQGHFKGGWTQPFLISIIFAAALAVLFVVT